MAKALFFLTAVDSTPSSTQANLTARLEQHFGEQPQTTVQLIKEPEVDFFYDPQPHQPR